MGRGGPGLLLLQPVNKDWIHHQFRVVVLVRRVRREVVLHVVLIVALLTQPWREHVAPQVRSPKPAAQAKEACADEQKAEDQTNRQLETDK